MRSLIKNGGIFNKGRHFNKGVSEARCTEEKVAQDVLRQFLILTDPVGGKDSLYKNLK
jgi:hypothetical protein